MIITNEKLFDLLPEIESNGGVSTSSEGKVNKTGTCYHITSHSFNSERIFNFETAQYRENLLLNISKMYRVRVVFSAVQPTHTHDVVFCRNFDDVMKVFRSLNCKVSRFIKKRNPKHYSIPGVKVFQERPAYRIVETYSHLLFLAKYLFDNGEELRKQNKKPPYSCFDEIQRGFYNNYPKEIYTKIFGLDIQEILNKCKELSKEEFKEYSNEFYRTVDKSEELQFFHTDSP